MNRTDRTSSTVDITDAEDGATLYTYGAFGGLQTMTQPLKAVMTTERDARVR